MLAPTWCAPVAVRRSHSHTLLCNVVPCWTLLQLNLFNSQRSLRRYAVSHHAILTFIDLLVAGAQNTQQRAAAGAKPSPTPLSVYTPRVVELVFKMINTIICNDNDMKVSPCSCLCEIRE